MTTHVRYLRRYRVKVKTKKEEVEQQMVGFSWMDVWERSVRRYGKYGKVTVIPVKSKE